MKTLRSLVLILILLPFISRAGGGCTWSDNCSGLPSISFCSTVSSENTGCDVSNGCDETDDVNLGAPNWVWDICDDCFHNNGGDGCFVIDGSGECSASVSVMGLTASCEFGSPICGSPENTSYAEVCYDNLQGPVACPFTYSVTSISCTGGGEALQWGVYTDAISCSNVYTANINNEFSYCTGAETSSDLQDLDMTPGYCHVMIFDGNANAGCTWDFSVSPSSSLTVAPVASDVTVCQECPIDGGGIPCVTIDGSLSECYSELSFNGGSYSSTTTSWSYCPPSVGVHTVTLDARLDLGGTCSVVNGTTANINVTVLPNTDPSCGCLPLKLELLDFKGYKEVATGDNILTWSVSEDAIDGDFHLERSEDGVAYEEISTIEWSEDVLDYQFIDENPHKSASYYRLYQVRESGEKDYSKSISITDNDLEFKFYSFYPNPVENKLNVSYLLNSKNKPNIELLTVSGKVVHEGQLVVSENSAGSIYSIDMTEFEKGIYFMNIIFNGESITKKIIKK